MKINEKHAGRYVVYEIKEFDPVNNGWDEIYDFCSFLRGVKHRSFSIEWAPAASHSFQSEAQVEKYIEGFWAGVQLFWRDIEEYEKQIEEKKSKKKKRKKRKKKSE